MMNHVWIILIVLGIIIGIYSATSDAIHEETFEARVEAVKSIGSDLTQKSFEMSQLAVNIRIEKEEKETNRTLKNMRYTYRQMHIASACFDVR